MFTQTCQTLNMSSELVFYLHTPVLSQVDPKRWRAERDRQSSRGYMVHIVNSAKELDCTLKRWRPNPTRKRAYTFLRSEAPFTRKITMFRATPIRFKSHPWCVKMKLSCDASFKFQELKMWKRRFRARLPSNSQSWRCQNMSSTQQFQCTKCS